MTAGTNGIARMRAISDVENSNDNECSSSSINQSSTEDENVGQDKINKNNNKSFVLKFGSRQSGDQATLQHSGHSSRRVDVGNAQAYFVFLLLSVSGLAVHGAFKQRERRQEEQEIEELLKRYASNEERSNNTTKSIKSTWTTGSASSVTSTARSTSTAATTGDQASSADTGQEDGGTHVLAEFWFRYGRSNLNSVPPASATKNPRAHLVVDVPSPGNTITGESTFLLGPADASAPFDEDDDNTNNSNNKKAGNDDNKSTKNGDSDGDSATNPITPERQDESLTATETTDASELDQGTNGQPIAGDEKSETVDDAAPIATAKEPEKEPSGNTIFHLTPATTTTDLSPPQGHGAEPLATLGLQRVLSMDLAGGSDTSSVVGRILLSLLAGGELTGDESAESDEDKEGGEDGAAESTRNEREEGAKDDDGDEEPTEIALEENAEVFYRVRMYTKSRTARLSSSDSQVKTDPRFQERATRCRMLERLLGNQQEPVGGEEEEATTDSDEGRENDGGTQTEDQNENAEDKKRDGKMQKKRKQALYRLRVYVKPPRKSELHQRPGR